ncbi:MAG: hypothetical protein AMXMBFR4_18220 [Candidatus Hydrogenedentota bacterium]
MTPEKTDDDRRSSALRFVIVFLLVTAALLSLSRYAVNTAPMNWYLFQVARQTSWVLRWAGESSWLENTERPPAAAGLVRASIDAWRAGRAIDTASIDPNDARPLSAYEIYVYRALKLEREHQTEKAAFGLTEKLPHLEFDSIGQRIAHLRQSLDRVRRSTRRETGSGPFEVAAPGVEDRLARCEKRLAALEQDFGADNAAGLAALDQVEAEIEEARMAQRLFLDRRVTQYTTQIQDRLGPLVMFVARSHATSPDLPERRFSFNLVPDCGALPSMSIFLAAMVAFPTTIRKRLIGLAIGLPILYAINVMRLACLALIGAWFDNAEVFEFAHVYVWQTIYIVVVVLVWMLWVELLVRPRPVWRKTPA